MSSGDPSQVDSRTLMESMRRDIAKSDEGLRQFFAYFHESQATLHELLRRMDKISGDSGPLYRVHKAGPRPMGQRYFICQDCDAVPDCPMLEDEVWYTICCKTDLLCIGCTEKRLGRQLTMKDPRDCPGNSFTFLVHNRLLSQGEPGMIPGRSQRE